MFREGSQIGLYTLIKILGRGGFGEVWLAERKSKFVTTKVAVKLPHDEQIDHETIKQEAQLWEQASGHPNILPIIDADEYDGQIVIVSEYAPDGSLDEWLKKNGKIPIEKAVETTIKILDGLEFLHSRNIIHRDLKPANILLQGETPRLADFGISRALRTTASSQSSNVSGTFAYMPPEGFDGKRSVQTDVWSVGVNLYQFLTGSLPFPNKEPSALIAAIMMRDFEPLPSDVPNNLQTAIARALAKQPENRYATAGEMREDLRRILRGEAVSDFIQPDSRQTFPAEQVTQVRKTAPFSANNSQDENETVVRSAPSFGQGEKRKSSNVWMYATLALVLVGLVGIIAYLFTSNQNKESEQNSSANKTNVENYNNSNIVLINDKNTNLNSNPNFTSQVNTVTNTNSKKILKETKNSNTSLVVSNLQRNISSGNMSDSSNMPRYQSNMRNYPSNIPSYQSNTPRSSVNMSGSIESNGNLATIYRIRAALRRQGLNNVRVTLNNNADVVLQGYVPEGRMSEAVQIALAVGERRVINQLSEK